MNENTPDGVNVGLPIQATDPDDNEAFTYKLETSGVPFALGSVNGQITVRNSKVIFSKFESNYLDGWTCGGITTCGSFGNICGGFGQKGKAEKIEKTFTGLESGTTYYLSLDILKIDSWDGERAKVDVNGVTCWTSKRLYPWHGNQVCGNRWYEDRLTAKCSAKAKMEL